MDEVVQGLNFSKIVEDLSEPIYKICPFSDDKDVRTPTFNTTTVNLSMAHTFETYPYLLPNLHPDRLTDLISRVPTNFKQEYPIVRYTIIDHQMYIEHESKDFDPESIYSVKRDLIPFMEELPDMDFVIFTRDSIHMGYTNNILENQKLGYAEFDGYYEIYKRIFVDLPGFMRSKDLFYDLEFNKLLIPDPYLLESRWRSTIQTVKKAS